MFFKKGATVKTPYIGITGFMNHIEASEVLHKMPDNSDRHLMVGLLSSLKILREQGNKWPRRYPKKKDMRFVFPISMQALNLIHYNTDEPEHLSDQLMWLTDLMDNTLDGFQLNIQWPTVNSLETFRKYNGASFIVLQIGSKAMSIGPTSVAERIASYRGLIDHVLIDASGGLGKSLNIEVTRSYLSAIADEGLNIGLGIAGGLCPSNIEMIKPLVKEFPDLSIDAEGRLRDMNDNLDLPLAKEYVLKSLAIFREMS